MKVTLPALMTVSAALLTLTPPLGAVMVCYDYAYYRLTGTDPAPRGAHQKYLGWDQVEAVLKARHYEPLGSELPGSLLKRGDVIWVPSHVGIVNGPDNIDHFIMVEGTSHDPNAVYDATRLPLHQLLGGLRGGLFVGDTLVQFLSRPFSRPTRYVVWRVEQFHLGAESAGERFRHDYGL